MNVKRSLKMLSESPVVTVEAVDLSSYDVICVSSSAGKDSQAMLDYVVELADKAGVRDRIVVVHADLGRVEWQGTKEFAEEQANHYGVRFEVVSRIGSVSDGRSKDGNALYAAGEVRGDLLDQVEHRAAQLKAQGKDSPAWMSSASRYCTADHKRGPIGTVFTKLADEWKKANPGAGRACRTLDCQGLRAAESPRRAKKANLENRTSTKSQHVDSWLPIQDWSTEQVWTRIKASGVPYHRAYDLGMPRLSCVFCIFASKDALMIAGKHNPELLSEYVRVEKETGYSFKADLSLASIQEALSAGEAVPVQVSDWDDAA
jgi:3'-phosphoadenosine 5'-phosphosulfate sulfotransferase (PAPS reductase)/FAD synthetase